MLWSALLVGSGLPLFALFLTHLALPVFLLLLLAAVSLIPLRFVALTLLIGHDGILLIVPKVGPQINHRFGARVPHC
jgi:hypothetical protein